jgi:hypothetical protein
MQGGGLLDQATIRGLVDVQQRFLLRLNYERDECLSNLEQQKELRRPLAGKLAFLERKCLIY